MLSKKYRKTYSADMPKMAVQGFDVVLYFSMKYLLLAEPSIGVMSDFKIESNGFPLYVSRATGKSMVGFKPFKDIISVLS